MPKVSVVVPAYNATKYIRQCLDSLRAQTLEDIEVILVDDGSTDADLPEGGTLAIMREYAAADPRFKVIAKPNTGYGNNINRGFAEATGEYLGILESDDFAEPDFLETLYTMAKEYDLDVARGQFWYYWSTPSERNELIKCFSAKECNKVVNPSDPAALPGDEVRNVFLAHPAIWSAIYKASFIREKGITCLETPGASYQDTGFNFKVWASATRVMFTEKPLIHYRQDNEASSVNNPGKVFAICAEWEEVWRWLNQERPELKEALTPVAMAEQWKTYKWNFERLAPEFKREFAERMRDDYAAYSKADLAANPRFTVEHHRMLRVLKQDIDLFCEWRTPVPAGASFGEKLKHKYATWRALQMTR